MGEPELLDDSAPAAVFGTAAAPAFTAWVEAHQHRLLRTAFLITGDEHLAQDLCRTR